MDVFNNLKSRVTSLISSAPPTTEETTPILATQDVEKGSERNGNENEDIFIEPRITQDNLFQDGITKIDFILVYEEIIKKKKLQRTLSKDELAEHKRKNNLEEMKNKWRIKYLKNLRRKGIVIEEERKTQPDKLIHFYKLSCPWHLLTYYAEELNIRAPLQLREYKSHHWSGKILSKLRMPNFMKLDVPNRPKLYFTCTFRKSKQSNFLGIDDPENYFSDTDRSRIVYEILQGNLFGKKKRAEQGIDRLLSEEVFSAAFPLHDGPYKLPKSTDGELDPTTLNKRQVLYEYWARWGRWYKYQPLDHIKSYFGEKIGIYFAWLGFYTAWLLPVAAVGFIVFLGGLIGMHTNEEAQDICNSGKKYMMCPLCSACSEWALSKSCIMTKLSFLFDNTGTVFFATLMSFWAVFFLEFWKRKSANLAHHWEAIGFEEEEEKPRPDYCARAPMLEVNPITGVLEPHFPPKQRIRRMLTGFGILLIMLFVVVIFVVSVILYKCIIGVIMLHSRSKLLHGESSVLTSMTGAVINLILIMLMSNVYTAVAEWLTKWEMHRTQTGYENALTLKVFIFQFVNYYSSIFYIAFFKGKLVGYPGHYATMFGIRNESCGNGGCLIELAQQLFIIMVGKQAINNVQELVVPKVVQWLQQRKFMKKEDRITSKTPWEKDYNKLCEFPGLFEEYLEMVLQFGFITIFVAAFPLAPFFALLNNWIEIRLDASKLVCELRRPVAHRAENIGIWYDILDALVQIAVITNAFLIAFTSEFIPRLLYQYVEGEGTLKGYVNFTMAYAPHNSGLGDCRYKSFRNRDGIHTLYYYELLACKLAFVIVFEHVVFFIGRMIDWGVPDVPESLQMKIKREQYLAKQALADNRDTSMEVMKLYHRSLSQEDFYDKQTGASGQLGAPLSKLKQKLNFFSANDLHTIQEEEGVETPPNIDEPEDRNNSAQPLPTPVPLNPFEVHESQHLAASFDEPGASPKSAPSSRTSSPRRRQAAAAVEGATRYPFGADTSNLSPQAASKDSALRRSSDPGKMPSHLRGSPKHLSSTATAGESPQGSDRPRSRSPSPRRQIAKVLRKVAHVRASPNSSPQLSDGGSGEEGITHSPKGFPSSPIRRRLLHSPDNSSADEDASPSRRRHLAARSKPRQKPTK